MRLWMRVLLVVVLFAGGSFSGAGAASGQSKAGFHCTFDLGQMQHLIAVTETLAIVGGDWAGYVHAVDLDKCTKSWTSEVDGYPGGVISGGEPKIHPPLSILVGDVLYVTAERGDPEYTDLAATVYAIDLYDGAVLWSFDLGDAMGKLTYHDGRIFALGENWITAIDATTGEFIWSEPIFMSMAGLVFLRRAEVIGDVVVYVDYLDKPSYEVTAEEAKGYEDRFGEIIGRSIETGERVWAQPIRNVGNYFLHAFPQSNRVVLASQSFEDGELAIFELTAVDVQTGEVLWRAEQSPFQRDLISGDSVGILTFADRQYVSFDVTSQETGDLIWSSPISSVRVPFFSTEDYFLLGTFDDPYVDRPVLESLIALDTATGEQLWEIPVGVARGESWIVPVSSDGRLYVFLLAGLASFDELTGQMLWTVDLPEGTSSMDMKLAGDRLVLTDAESNLHVVTLE